MNKRIKDGIKGLILDMDGVLWRGTEPIGDLPKLFGTMKDMGLKVLLATNNTLSTPEQYRDKLAKFGVVFPAENIITSSLATGFLVKEKYPKGSTVFVIGSDALKKAVTDNGFILGEEDAVAVVVGLTRDINFETMSTATLLIRGGAKFIGTNPDPSFPSPRGLIPGTGAVLAYLEVASDQKPLIAGKPYQNMMNMALDRLKITPQETLMIGDRLTTDIRFGQNAGCRTGVVLTGVSTQEEIDNWKPAPDFIADDLSSIIKTLE